MRITTNRNPTMDRLCVLRHVSCLSSPHATGLLGRARPITDHTERRCAMRFQLGLLVAILGLSVSVMTPTASGLERPVLIFLEGSTPVLPGPDAHLQVLSTVGTFHVPDACTGCCSPFFDEQQFCANLISQTLSIQKVLLFDPPGPPTMTQAVMVNLVPCNNETSFALPPGTCIGSLTVNPCVPPSGCEAIPFLHVGLTGNVNCPEDPTACH